MSTEENKAVVRRAFEELFNRGKLEIADEVIAPEFVNHAAPPEMKHGPEGLKRLVSWLRSAFPDARHEIEDEIAEGDKVVVHVTFSCTHQGEFMGMPPTGKSFSQKQMHIIRMTGGKAIEHWAVRDDLGMMQQLGLIPSPDL